MKEVDFNKIISQVEKTYGKGAVMTLTKEAIDKDVDVISTGSLLLDDAIGIGGYPKGRIVEIYGPESSGKTTMALLAVAEAQKAGGYAAFIDVEHAIDPKHAKNLGVDLDKLLIAQPDSGEQALQLVDELTTTGQFSLIVIDSVAALTPLAELEGQMEDQTIGALARLMSKSMRKLAGTISKTNTVVLFINQIREKVGVIFGNPEVTPGGRGLKFAASLRLDIRLRERIKEKDDQIGQKVKVKVVKNKMAPPFKEIETIIYYKDGINQIEEIIELGTNTGVIDRAGAWYSFDGIKLGQGKIEAAKYIIENNLQDALKEKLFNNQDSKEEETSKEDKPKKETKITSKSKTTKTKK